MLETGTGSRAEKRGAARSSAEAVGSKEYGVDRYEATAEVREAISRMLRGNRDNPIPPGSNPGEKLDAGSGIATLGDILEIVEQDTEIIEHMALSIVDQLTELRECLGLMN